MEYAGDLARLEEEHAVVRGEARDPILDEVREVPSHPTGAGRGAREREPEIPSRGRPRSHPVAVVPGRARRRVDLRDAERGLKQRCSAPGRAVEESLRVVEVV